MSSPAAPLAVTHLLASYPHVARCPQCREYADDYLASHSATTVLAAVLNHHDSAHVSDRLSPRCAHF